MSDENGEIVFDSLELREIPVKLEGKDYILRESSSTASIAYRNAIMSSAKIGEDGKATSVSNIAGAEPVLVSHCLFKVTTAPSGSTTLTQVPVETIRGWPSKIADTLYKKLRAISNLDDKEETEEEVKNEPSDTPTGSS